MTGPALESDRMFTPSPGVPSVRNFGVKSDRNLRKGSMAFYKVRKARFFSGSGLHVPRIQRDFLKSGSPSARILFFCSPEPEMSGSFAHPEQTMRNSG
ncbi:hypothetical protein BOX30_01330 [Leptospirillum ferriphilum]|nr:hypothetical protein BOX30_01330 [Leptospirillum ferriphilum]